VRKVRQEGPIRVESDHADRYPGADKLATESVINLIRTASMLTGELERRFRRHGLTGPGFNALMVLAGATGPLSPYQVGERLLVTRGTVTGLLDTLQRQGHIRRVPHPDDRRMLLIELTDRAYMLLEEVRGDLFPAQAAMMVVLTEQEKESLIRTLGKLQVALLERAARGEHAPS
jgi:DNA-binding MarR family transcriptional regulator